MKALTLEEIKAVLHADLRTPLGHALIKRVCTDSRCVKPGDLFVALSGPSFDGHDYIDAAVAAGAAGVLMRKSLPISSTVKERGVCVMRVDDTIEALGVLARHYRRSLRHQLTVIAVTGSNGKTTTREMIHHVLSKSRSGHRSPASYNNHIGVPLTLLGVDGHHEFAVVEIGSNAPGEVAALSRIAEPDIAVITHIGPAHLAGFADLDGVSREKASIIAGLAERGVIVCNAAHPPTVERLRSQGRSVITFSADGGEADLTALHVRSRGGEVEFTTNDHCRVVLPLGGAHNAGNALAALAVARRLGLTTKEFAEAIADFEGVPGRMQYRHFNGIVVIDDTYNANPASMAAALNELTSLSGLSRRVLICGDMGELGEESQEYHRQLGRHIAASNVDMLMTVGELGAVTARAALEAGMGRGQVQRAVSSVRLARLVKSRIFDGDVILVKGSRFMQMEKVVESLSRWRGVARVNERPRTFGAGIGNIPGLNRAGRRELVR